MPTIRSRRALRALIAVAALATAACGDDDGSRPKLIPSSSLAVIVQDDQAPPLEAVVKSFYAVRGQDREVRLYYALRSGETEQEEFLRLRVRDGSLLALPNGTPIAFGDSVLITVRVPDPSKFLVELEPSGLRFSLSEPAELKWKLGESDDSYDSDDDGIRVDDLPLLADFGVWRQETASAPWARLISRTEVELDEIEVHLVGFSNYAVAYRSQPVE